MKSTIIKLGVFITLLSLIFACVNDDFKEPDTAVKTYELTPNKTIANLVATTTGVATLYTADDIIEAYVTSSDETGNFYSTICFQSEPNTNINPIGLSISVDLKSFGHGFTPGRKVYIKLKGLYTAIIDGSLKIGGLYGSEIGRISNFDWNKYLFPSATVLTETQLVRTLTLAQAATNPNLNTLVDINNVQFADNSLARSLFDIDSGGGATNHNIIDVAGGPTRFLRISSFATFARQGIPAGRGKIRGIMTKYGSDFQFIIRSSNDLKLNNPRTYTFPGTVNENFQAFATNQKNFPNYLNFTTLGTKNWTVKSNNFLEMSAFSGFSFPSIIEKNVTYFLVPVNMTTANNFSFQVKIQFFSNRAGLKIYRTMDFVPGMKLKDATLYDISGSFSIPSATTDTFASAGVYTIPTNVIGNGYFVFEYTGSSLTSEPLATTTVQIDNILVN